MRAVSICYPEKGQSMLALNFLSPALYGLALPRFTTPASVIGAESYGVEKAWQSSWSSSPLFDETPLCFHAIHLDVFWK